MQPLEPKKKHFANMTEIDNHIMQDSNNGPHTQIIDKRCGNVTYYQKIG